MPRVSRRSASSARVKEVVPSIRKTPLTHTEENCSAPDNKLDIGEEKLSASVPDAKPDRRVVRGADAGTGPSRGSPLTGACEAAEPAASILGQEPDLTTAAPHAANTLTFTEAIETGEDPLPVKDESVSCEKEDTLYEKSKDSDEENKDPDDYHHRHKADAEAEAERIRSEHELREARYQRLMRLLNTSQFYVNYLVDKIDEQNADLKKKLAARKDRVQKRLEKQSAVCASEEQAPRRSTRERTNKVETPQKRKRGERSRGSRKVARTEGDGTASSSQETAEESPAGSQDLSSEAAQTGSATDLAAGAAGSGAKENDQQPRLLSGGSLRDYQLEGYNWLRMMFENGVNCILGDEMGLGKTIQTISLIAYLMEQGVVGPFLIIAPLSTLPNWISEFARFSPDVPVVLYHGPERKSQLSKIGKFNKIAGCNIPVHPVVLTSYDLIMRDAKELSRHEYRYLVVDEGHRLKNHQCRLVRELRRYRAVSRLILTGTPLQNSLQELWALLNFLLPEIFDDLAVFESWFDATEMTSSVNDDKIVAMEREKQVVTTLHRILTPFLLRRIKRDVDLQIPPKRELLVYCPLVEDQAKLYRSAADKTIARLMDQRHGKDPNSPLQLDQKGRPKRGHKEQISFSFLFSDGADVLKEEAAWEQGLRKLDEVRSAAQKPKAVKNARIHLPLQSTMMTLRHVVNHPFLVEHPIDPETKEYLLVPEVAEKSGKMMVLDAMVSRLRARGHKILIFSQFSMMLDVISDMMEVRGHQFVRLDGSCSVENRQESMADFSADPDVGIFLLSTRAGGLGINLSSADTVIIYDSDWNPQRDLQAQDRAHRIGQIRPVMVYRLVTGGTIDEAIVERAAAKRKLERMVMHAGKFKSARRDQVGTSLAAIAPEELLVLLRQTQHHRVVKSGGQVFSEDEMEQLLNRSDLEDAWKERKGLAAPAETKGVFKVMEEIATEL